MKEQPVENREHVIGHSIGQRPIHATYEPPGPLPQFRSRPKLSPASQPQPVPKRLLHVASAVKATQRVSQEPSSGKETRVSQKGS
ncbi:hypothetical protein F4X10_20510 [Candidatus Poribacteria bacterium]|nr:hypothetical protein [Candidatus Poribacteria bacterium]